MRGDGVRPRLAVSVINYRTGPMTLDCLRATLAGLEGVDGRVVVVDNLSGDGSAELIEAWIAAQDPPAPVTLLRSELNAGFAGGHNRGMAAVEADAYLLLNSDAVPRPGALAALLEAMDRDPTAGVIGARLEDEDGTPQICCFRLHSPLSELIRGAEVGLVARLLRRWSTPLPPPDPYPGEIDWVSFAAVLVRAETAAAIGPMDEGYFLYFEDMDYCWRARRAGWRVVHAPLARVVHHRGGSAPVKRLAAARKRLPAYYYASRTRFFRKVYGRAGPLAANLMFCLGLALGRLKGFAGKRRLPIEGEARDIWINVLSPLGDRRAPGA